MKSQKFSASFRMVASCVLVLASFLLADGADGKPAVRIGIAWQPSQAKAESVKRIVEAVGGEPVALPQLRMAGWDYDGVLVNDKYLDEQGMLLEAWADSVKRDTYHGNGADVVLADVDAVVFLGGGDVCPTLFATPEPWTGGEEDCHFDVARDISEYLTMAYCFDHDIPVLGLCRGMQMIGVVSGAPLIQDLGLYYQSLGKAYRFVHRDADRQYFMSHDVVVTDHASLLFSIAGCDTIRNVPSWHHQAVGDIAGTPLKVTAVTVDDGVTVIEAIERTDQTFALGVQYHPEVAARKHIDHEPDAARFMSLNDGLAYFRALINAARQVQKR